MIDIRFIIKDFLKSKSFQEFINNRFLDVDAQGNVRKIVIPISGTKIISYDGKTLFYVDKFIPTIDVVKTEYQYNDIRKTDVVLDIGGCIGAYGLQISHDVKHVYIVEPITDELIRKNIELTKRFNNTMKNVDVFKCALGKENGEIEVRFHDGIAKVPTHSLTYLKKLCGGHVDVLKMDCEGGEWSIEPHELDGIRRIEMEIHTGYIYNNGYKIVFSENKKVRDYINMLTNSGFECEYIIHKLSSYNIALLHATNTKGRFNGN